MSGGTSFNSAAKKSDDEDEEKSEEKDDKEEEELEGDDEAAMAEKKAKAAVPTPAGEKLKVADYSHSDLKTNDPDRKEEVEIKAPKTIEQVVDAAVAETPLIPNAAAPNDLSLMEKISAAFNKSSVRIKR